MATARHLLDHMTGQMMERSAAALLIELMSRWANSSGQRRDPRTWLVSGMVSAAWRFMNTKKVKDDYGFNHEETCAVIAKMLAWALTDYGTWRGKLTANRAITMRIDAFNT